jgi:hypothetical protein
MTVSEFAKQLQEEELQFWQEFVGKWHLGFCRGFSPETKNRRVGTF